MKFQTVVLFTLNLAELQYLHDVLCPTPSLSGDAEDLHNALADAVDAAFSSGAAVDDIEAEITLSAELIEEVTPLLAKRSVKKDRGVGLNPSVGFDVAEAFLDAILEIRRAKTPTTLGEVKGLTFRNETLEAAVQRFANLFGQNGLQN
jgi:hypothetical protein